MIVFHEYKVGSLILSNADLAFSRFLILESECTAKILVRDTCREVLEVSKDELGLGFLHGHCCVKLTYPSLSISTFFEEMRMN